MALITGTHYRVAPRGLLVAELLDFATDRTSHGKLERAAAARVAAAELEGGAERVFVEDLWRVVGDEPDRYTLYGGTRDEVLAQLDADGPAYLHVGNEAAARQAARALDEVRTGAQRARVGHIVYDVLPDPAQVVHPQPLHDGASGLTVTSGS